MGIEDLKPYQFTSKNQPPNESKRVPKWKSHLKKLLKENYKEISEEIINHCKKGSIKHIEFLRDWLYGKVKEEHEHKGTFNIKEFDIELSDKEKEEFKKRIKEFYGIDKTE